MWPLASSTSAAAARPGPRSRGRAAQAEGGTQDAWAVLHRAAQGGPALCPPGLTQIWGITRGSGSSAPALCIHLSVWSASARLRDLLISPAPAPSCSLSWRWHYNITSEPRLILKPQLLSPFTSAANVAAASEAALLPSLHTGSQRLIYWSVSLLGLHFTSCYCPQTGCSSPEVRAAVK